MEKKQIRINEVTIKDLVRKAVTESRYFGIDNAIKKGVWSSDDPEAADDIKKIEDDDRFQASWFGYNDPGNEMSDLMYKRAKGEDSELPREKGYGMGLNTKAEDERMRELFGDKEKEGKMYDENPEGEENLYFSDPDLEEPDEDEDIAGINEVRLNEEGLRNFISYSVAKILQERLGEENRGIMAHFDGSSSFQPKNPYENMTWDEYCAAKADERQKDKEREMKDAEVKDEKPNRGIMTHFGGEKHEKTPEDIERDEHMFDDQYWVDKMNLSESDIKEMVDACVKKLTEVMDNHEEEEVVDRFPKKASGTFTMNTRSGKTDKYRVFVEKTYDEELLTDIFIYDPMDKEWYPQAEYVVGIEEYKDGSWLPYWESFNGDVSIRALANCFGKVVKLWQKVGYLYDEDDEIPFRYAGDIKGLNGKRY